MSDIQPIADFVAQNSAVLKASGVGGTTAFLLKPVGKMLLEHCSKYLGIVVNSKEVVARARAEGEAALVSTRLDLDAQKLKAIGAAELSDIEKRARERVLNQAVEEQRNIDSIVLMAAQSVSDSARPQDINEDWKSNFFDKSRSISDEDMQLLMSRILSGEANSPGTYSKRTVNFIQSMSSKEAASFLRLCRFIVKVNQGRSPLIINHRNDIYKDNGINYYLISNLASLGLIVHSENTLNWHMDSDEAEITISYFEDSFSISPRFDVNFGTVLFTDLGGQLSKAFAPEPIPKFVEYIKEYYLPTY